LHLGSFETCLSFKAVSLDDNPIDGVIDSNLPKQPTVSRKDSSNLNRQKEHLFPETRRRPTIP
jgi:hypothetical protein